MSPCKSEMRCGGDGGYLRAFTNNFYGTKKWKECRNAFFIAKNGLCERCLARGKYTPAEIAHHIVPLSPENINDPNITLNWSNLQALCRDCHAEVHDKANARYKLDELGRVIVK